MKQFECFMVLFIMLYMDNIVSDLRNVTGYSMFTGQDSQDFSLSLLCVFPVVMSLHRAMAKDWQVFYQHVSLYSKTCM